MTIELQTGLPGHCKTLYTLDRIEALRKKTGRPVFYNGIAIVKDKLPEWHEIEADKWYTAPPESIVVIDEAQRIFRPRPAGSQVPKHESELETHRHGGIDLVLMTQKPSLISKQVRELVGRHLHAVRRFGTQTSTIHEWPELKQNVQSRKDSIKSVYKFNKEVFTWYKSAEAHTVTRNVPMRVYVLMVMVVLLPLLIGYIVYRVFGYAKGSELPGTPTKQTAAPLMTQSEPSQGGGGSGVKLTALQYVAQFQPRVQGLAYTAPAYDEVTKPVEAPYPAAVIASAKRCVAYTQQGTRLDMPEALCRQIATTGFFVAWKQSAPPTPQPAQEKRLQEPLATFTGWASLGGDPRSHIMATSSNVTGNVDQAPSRAAARSLATN